jgi:hypothetical protein
MSSYLPRGAYATPLQVGDKKYETIWHANSFKEFREGSQPDKGMRREAITCLRRHEGQSDWFGVDGEGEAITTPERVYEVEKEGHKLFASKIREYAKQVPELLVPRRKMLRKRVFDDGEEIDIDRYLDGKADYWNRYIRGKSEGIGYVCIWVSLGINCDKTPEQALWRGMVAASLAEALDKQGHSVEIRAYDFAYGVYQEHLTRSYSLLSFPVKTFDEQLQLEKACVPLCLAGWFRTRVFACRYRRPDCAPVRYLGREENSSIPKEALPAGADDIFVEDIWNERAAVGFLKEQVARFQSKLGKGVDVYA